ncbi:CGNR zinc finger domain-containing protein [Kribbella sp. GL6]|uniref:CGNR zinc finger domain-containing protein n=1 Tax=Kribbella sp. GL6 TaxID=3419765 RepID=UPI003D07EC58
MTSLAFALAATIKHDGHGGISDLLATPEQTAAWLRECPTDLGRFLPPTGTEILPTLDEGRVWRELVRMRGAVRALFARAVAPGAPSKADADRLMKVEDALEVVNQAAELLGTTRLEWDEKPSVRWAYRTDDPVGLLMGAVGRSAIEFLTGPDRTRLRACPAARCVKYFLQDDPRQTWCSPACGNRERVNRHYRKRAAG